MKEEAGTFEVRLVVPERGHTARNVAGQRWLDLDDLGSVISE
jgi:hypothetical protein